MSTATPGVNIFRSCSMRPWEVAARPVGLAAGAAAEASLSHRAQTRPPGARHRRSIRQCSRTATPRRQFRNIWRGRCLRTRAPKLFGEAEATHKSSAQLSLSRNGYGQAD